MARKIDPALLKLNEYPNLQMKVRKSDGRRHTVEHVNGELGNDLQEANSPAEIGAIAMSHGIRMEEVIERGKSAPNFGQFRMVLGNRIAAIARRHAASPDMTAAEAAYPKEAAKARREANKAKTAAKKAKAPKAIKKKVGKKVGKRAGKRPARPGRTAQGFRIKGEDGENAPSPAQTPEDAVS